MCIHTCLYMYIYIHIYVCIYILPSGKEALTHHGHFSSSGTSGGVREREILVLFILLESCLYRCDSIALTIYIIVFDAGFGHVWRGSIFVWKRRRRRRRRSPFFLFALDGAWCSPRCELWHPFHIRVIFIKT